VGRVAQHRRTRWFFGCPVLAAGEGRAFCKNAGDRVRLQTTCYFSTSIVTSISSLEGFGYIVRSDAPGEGRARMIRFTKRGRAAYSRIYDILLDIEREWSAELGPKRFAQFKELLWRVWESPLAR
jgi:hypothetical protein